MNTKEKIPTQISPEILEELLPCLEETVRRSKEPEIIISAMNETFGRALGSENPMVRECAIRMLKEIIKMKDRIQDEREVKRCIPNLSIENMNISKSIVGQNMGSTKAEYAGEKQLIETI